jgi:capsular polysaccharide transport system permease protein
MNSYDAIRFAVGEAHAETPAARRQVYKALTDELQSQIVATQPRMRSPLAERLRALRQAIQEFEQDFVAGTLRAPLPEGDRAPPDPSLSMVSDPAPRAHPLGRIRTIVALTLRYLRHLSRIGPAAAMWLVVEPILQMSIIVAIYSLLGAASIMDMDPFPFVVLGVASWFMFRIIMLRTSVMAMDRGLHLLPRVRLIDVIISRALSYVIIYTWALVFFMTLVELSGRGSAPDNLSGMVLSWSAVALLGLGFGLVLRGLIDHVPVLVRFAPWIVRIFFYTSGVVYVSEQIPDFIAKYLLFNPALHAIQSLRADFFISYETREVSLVYAFCWAIGLIALGLTMQAERLSRHR